VHCSAPPPEHRQRERRPAQPGRPDSLPPAFVLFSVELRHKLRFENRFLGYVCVVDEEGVVRWHVHSNEKPTPKQIEALRKLLVRP